MDPVGFGTWTERRKYFFQCSLTGFANDKIRVFYKINGTAGVTLPVFENDSKEGNGKKELNDTEKNGVIFSKSIAVKHQIFCEYDNELIGLTNYIWMWHNSNKNESAYNFWNFS